MSFGPSMSLPVEIWEVILNLLEEDDDFQALSLVNRSFCVLAQKNLYTNIYLHKSSSTILFCDTVLRRRRDLATRVRRLRIPFFETRPFASSTRIRLTAYTRLLFRTLRLLQGLQHLSFTDDAYTEDMTGPLPPWACENLAGSSFKLLTLSITASDGLPRSFLEEQTSLISLEFTDFFGEASSYATDMDQLTPGALPTLTNAVLTWRAAERIVPNRPVTTLAIIQQRQSEAVVAAGLARIAEATGPLRTLSIDFLSIKYNIIPLIADALPFLRELSIGITLGDGSDFDEWLSSRETHAAFLSFRTLRSIRLRVSRWRNLDQDRRPLVEAWGVSCPTLSEVKFYTFRPTVTGRPIFSVTHSRREQASERDGWTSVEQ